MDVPGEVKDPTPENGKTLCRDLTELGSYVVRDFFAVTFNHWTLSNTASDNKRWVQYLS